MKEETMAMDPKLMKMLEEEYEALYKIGRAHV